MIFDVQRDLAFVYWLIQLVCLDLIMATVMTEQRRTLLPPVGNSISNSEKHCRIIIVVEQSFT